MPFRSILRTTAAVALAVPAIVGLSAVAASADETTDVTTVQAPIVVADAPAPAPAPAPVVEDHVAETPAADEQAPPLVTAAYTRW